MRESLARRSLSKDKSSRIKFKRISGTRRLTIGDSEEITFGKHMYFEESYQNINISSSEDFTDLLEPKFCYHRECCFAYNITGDSRNPLLLAECLPMVTYKKLATMWNLNPDVTPRPTGNYCKYELAEEEEENKMVDEYVKFVERDMGLDSEISEDLRVDAGSCEEEDMFEDYDEKMWFKKNNPYLKFLKKATIADSDEKKIPNLGKKAGKITKMIIGNFMKWYESLGAGEGEDSFIDEHTLHELFQVGFDMPAAKPMAIRIKEMPTVPECLATLRNEPKHSTTYALRKFLKRDIHLEAIPTKMFAFGSMLPKGKNLRYKPPKNNVQKNWMECSRVPKDLNTMKTVWLGLERLRSTIAFSNWLKNHPEITAPTYLQEQGLLKINYEEWNQMYKGFELDVNLHLGGSETKISHDKSLSKASSALSYSNSMKFNESSESFL